MSQKKTGFTDNTQSWQWASVLNSVSLFTASLLLKYICTYTSTYIWTLYIRSYLRSNWKKSEEYKTITVWVVHIEHWKRFPLLISFLCRDPHSLIFSLCFQWFQATPEKYIYTYVRIPLRMAIRIVTKRSEIVRTIPTINNCKIENLWLKVMDE